MLSRWRWHRAIGRRFGWLARLQVKTMSDFELSYYVAFWRNRDTLPLLVGPSWARQS
jgi:hypothetical protein